MECSLEDRGVRAYANLLPEIEVGELLGEGKRSHVYQAQFEGQDAVLKLYKKKYADKYRERYGVCIAEFEFKRNQSFYEHPHLRRYTVKPLAVFPGDGTNQSAFIQGLAPGRPMLEVMAELGFLPEETFQAGLDLVAHARRAGIHDLDINDGNVNVHKTDEGWLPVIYDFNIMPQYLFPTNPFIALGFKLKLKDRSYRDLRSVRGWRMRGLEIEKENKQRSIRS